MHVSQYRLSKSRQTEYIRRDPLDFFLENSYFPCGIFTMEQAHFTIIFWHNLFICLRIFEIFSPRFKDVLNENEFMVIFVRKVILKKAVSGGWCLDSCHIF